MLINSNRLPIDLVTLTKEELRDTSLQWQPGRRAGPWFNRMGLREQSWWKIQWVGHTHLLSIMVQMCLHVCGTLIDVMWESRKQNSMVQHVNANACNKCMSVTRCVLVMYLIIESIIMRHITTFFTNSVISKKWWCTESLFVSLSVRYTIAMPILIRCWDDELFSPWRIVGLQNSMHLLFRRKLTNVC